MHADKFPFLFFLPFIMTSQAIFQRLERLWMCRTLPDMEDTPDSHQNTEFLSCWLDTECLDFNKAYSLGIDSTV